MRLQRPRNATARVTAALVLSVVVELGMRGTAYAAVPVVQFVSSTSPSNSDPAKMAKAECPMGTRVLGGAAKINKGEGQVTIQAAFPTHDLGLNRDLFVVKARVGLGAMGSWSVTADAYCTPSAIPTIVEVESPFDSDPIKSALVECPHGMKVVGMGGEVSNDLYSHPAALVGNIPVAKVVFQGFEADEDLTKVTARATEVGAPLGDSFAQSWKVTAIAACALPFYFDDLELMRNASLGGCLGCLETETKVGIACSSKNKRIISAASTIEDSDMGYWYLHRFSRSNAFAFQNQIYAEAYLNQGASTVDQTAYIICVAK